MVGTAGQANMPGKPLPHMELYWVLWFEPVSVILVHGGPVKRFVKIHRVYASEILLASNSFSSVFPSSWCTLNHRLDMEGEKVRKKKIKQSVWR